jgi:hypothetical protein
LRMKRRKTVSVTPAIGARTVAGEIRTLPIERLVGTGCSGTGWRTKVSTPHVTVPDAAELSQNFFTALFYLSEQSEAPAGAGA